MQKDGDWRFPTHGESYKPALTRKHDEIKWRFGVFFPLEQATFLAVKKEKKKNLHSWSSLWWQRVVKSFGPDSPVPMWGYFSLNSDAVLSVDDAHRH